MHFDPYESKQSKRRRILSDVLIVITIVALLLGIISLFVDKETAVKPYTFKTVEAVSVDKSSTTEFVDLHKLLTSSETVSLDKDFSEKFPVSAALLQMDIEVYDEKVPYVSFDGDVVVVAQTIISEDINCRDLEIAIFNGKHATNDGKYIYTVDDIKRFSAKLNTKDNSVTYEKFQSNKFRMDIHSLTLTLENAQVSQQGYVLTLNTKLSPEAIDDLGYREVVYDPVGRTHGDIKINTVKEKSVITADAITNKSKKNKSEFVVSINKDLIEDLDSLTLEFTTPCPENMIVTASVN